jgi:hypothetical protein
MTEQQMQVYEDLLSLSELATHVSGRLASLAERQKRSVGAQVTYGTTTKPVSAAEPLDRGSLVVGIDAVEAEKRRRCYYQQIVYDVCNILDAHMKNKPGSGIVCGTVDDPTDEVQRVLRVVLEKKGA